MCGLGCVIVRCCACADVAASAAARRLDAFDERLSHRGPDSKGRLLLRVGSHNSTSSSSHDTTNRAADVEVLASAASGREAVCIPFTGSSSVAVDSELRPEDHASVGIAGGAMSDGGSGNDGDKSACRGFSGTSTGVGGDTSACHTRDDETPPIRCTPIDDTCRWPCPSCGTEDIVDAGEADAGSAASSGNGGGKAAGAAFVLGMTAHVLSMRGQLTQQPLFNRDHG